MKYKAITAFALGSIMFLGALAPAFAWEELVSDIPPKSFFDKVSANANGSSLEPDISKYVASEFNSAYAAEMSKLRCDNMQERYDYQNQQQITVRTGAGDIVEMYATVTAIYDFMNQNDCGEINVNGVEEESQTGEYLGKATTNLNGITAEVTWIEKKKIGSKYMAEVLICTSNFVIKAPTLVISSDVEIQAIELTQFVLSKNQCIAPIVDISLKDMSTVSAQVETILTLEVLELLLK